jgi:hypothetical protein
MNNIGLQPVRRLEYKGFGAFAAGRTFANRLVETWTSRCAGIAGRKSNGKRSFV